MVDDGGRRSRTEFRGETKRFFANHVVGPVAHLQHRIRVHARPRLDGSVDIQCLLLRAEAHQIETRDIDRKIQEKVASPDVSAEDATMIRGREMRVLETRAAFLRKPPPLLVRRQHHEPTFALEGDVAADDRQDALANAAAADDDDAALEVDARHGALLRGFIRRLSSVRLTARSVPDKAASTATFSDASRLSKTTLGKLRNTTLIRHD